MDVRKFQAPTLREALFLVKKELGPDAIILQTRSARTGGILGLWSREVAEVTATRDGRELSNGRGNGNGKGSGRLPKAAPAGAAAEIDRLAFKVLERDLAHVRTAVEAIMARGGSGEVSGLPPALTAAFEVLVQSEVSREIAREVVCRVNADLSGPALQNRDAVRERLEAILRDRIRVGGPIAVRRGERKVIAFIGPTGVGKTTTIAKVAANFKISEGLRVGLITIDTYRLAAVEQLRKYAHIMTVPMRVVNSPEELRAVVEEFSDRDVILIDTAGRGQRDEIKMKELEGFLRAVPPDETHLVVPTTANRHTALEVLHHFSRLPVHRVILSKVDEASRLGVVMDIAAATEHPFSYVTTGQGVPDDIAPCDPVTVARSILGGY